MKNLGLKVVLFLLVSACSGWNSELNTLNIPDSKIQQKPQCQFKTKDNCFSRSMNLLMSCVNTTGQHEEILTEDLRLCSNEKGKQIIFDTPLDLVGNFEENVLSFTIYSEQNKCFRFTGTSQNFKIDQNPFGEIEVKTLSNGDTQVSCFFNESFTVTEEIKNLGCRDEKTKVAQFLPKAQLKQKKAPQFLEPSDINSFGFSFEGLEVPAEIFNCRL